MHCIQFCISVCFPSLVQNNSWFFLALASEEACRVRWLLLFSAWVHTGTLSSTVKGGQSSQFLRTKGYQNWLLHPQGAPNSKACEFSGAPTWWKKQECCLQHKSPLLLFACILSNFQYGFIFSVDFSLRISFTAWEALPRYRVPLPLTQSSCPGDGAVLTSGATLCCPAEAVSAHSKVGEIAQGQWKTENIVSNTLTHWSYSMLLTPVYSFAFPLKFDAFFNVNKLRIISLTLLGGPGLWDRRLY